MCIKMWVEYASKKGSQQYKNLYFSLFDIIGRIKRRSFQRKQHVVLESLYVYVICKNITCHHIMHRKKVRSYLHTNDSMSSVCLPSLNASLTCCRLYGYWGRRILFNKTWRKSPSSFKFNFISFQTFLT